MGGFEEFIKNGALTNMESTMPPMTGPSWPSIYTGFRPGKHGVPEFLKMEPNYTKSVVYYDPKIKAPFWDSLSQNGLKSLVITPAMLVEPSTEPNVDMITGFPLQSKCSSKRIKAIADKYHYTGEPEIETKMKSGEVSLQKASSIYKESIDTRSRMSKELINNNEYDLSFICFTEQDRLQHFSLNNQRWRDYILPLYESISDFMLWVEERARRERSTVMVVSDHGAQPIEKKFLMNGWLVHKKYAAFTKAIEEGINTNKGVMRYVVREKLLSSVSKSGSRKLLYDKLPPSLKGIAKSTISKMLSGTSPEDYTRIHDFDYDMKKTVAFASIANCPVTTIFINDNRFESGIVTKMERPRIKKRLMEDLAKIKDKDGKKLIINVWDADEYYEGTKLFIAPDIFAEIRDGYILDAFGYLKSGGLTIDPEMAKSGDHQRNGIFGVMSYNRSIDYGKISRKKLYVYNVQPTIMRYFGLNPHNDSRYSAIFQ